VCIQRLRAQSIRHDVQPLQSQIGYDDDEAAFVLVAGFDAFDM
jgi:hypothetical protein